MDLQPIIEAARENIRTVMERDGVPGVSVALIDNGQPVWAESFGLTDVVDSCTVPFVTAHAICTDPGSYLFWDGTHPTTVGHAIVAKAVLSLLPPQ